MMTQCIRPAVGRALAAGAADDSLHARQPRAQAHGPRAPQTRSSPSAPRSPPIFERARRSSRGRGIEIIPNPVDVAGPAGQSRRRADGADRRTLRALPRQARAEQGHVAPGRHRRARAPRLAARHRRRWAGSVDARGRGRALRSRTSGWSAGSISEQTAAWLAHASLLIFPSRGPESLSRVLIEASALGVPIAAMNTGGTPDIVRHGETGCCRRRRRRSRTTSGGLRDDEPLRARLGAAARLSGANGSSTRPPSSRASRSLYRDILSSATDDRTGQQSVTIPIISIASCASPSSPARSSRCTAWAGSSGTSTTSCSISPTQAWKSTLITRPAEDARHAPDERSIRASRSSTVPYRTFPLAGRRGTTVLDRSTAYPLFGLRAGRVAWDLVRAGEVDIVHGLGASVLGYARRRPRAQRPLVLNPQGLEEFGATDPAGARLKRAGYLPLRRAVLACARAADRVIATDRALEPVVLQHLRVPPAKVRVIPNALDLRADRSAGKSARTGARVRLALGHRAGRCRAAERGPARGEQGLPCAGGGARRAARARRPAA